MSFLLKYACLGLSTAKNNPMCANIGTKIKPSKMGQYSAVPKTTFKPSTFVTNL